MGKHPSNKVNVICAEANYRISINQYKPCAGTAIYKHFTTHYTYTHTLQRLHWQATTMYDCIVSWQKANSNTIYSKM